MMQLTLLFTVDELPTEVEELMEDNDQDPHATKHRPCQPHLHGGTYQQHTESYLQHTHTHTHHTHAHTQCNNGQSC